MEVNISGEQHTVLDGQPLRIELVDEQNQDEYTRNYNWNGFYIDNVHLQKLTQSMASFVAFGDANVTSATTSMIQSLTPMLTSAVF